MIILLLLISALSPIEKLLHNTSSSEQVVKVMETFNEDKYCLIFDYVPNINPLNPEKMKRFSSNFGVRFHPIDKTNKPHLGLDISAPKNVPVHVSASGEVIRISYQKGYGKIIIVKHKYGFITKYAHLNEILTKVNNKVSKGDIIGRVGSTGKSTGDHLHYEILKNNRHIDPYPLVTIY